MTTKVDFINGAYKELRISGLTVSPTPEDLDLALDTLENLANELEADNVCVHYNFEETPDINSLHNVDRKFWHSFNVILAVRLCDAFGKQVPQTLFARYQSAISFLYARTAVLRPVQYPPRQPIGSKNRFWDNQRFYTPVSEAPIGCATNEMYIGDITDFIESFQAWLNDSEIIASYTIDANDGLTIVSDSNTDTEVSYQIQADGSSEISTNDLLKVKIVVTSSDSRIETRIINFKLNSADL